VEEDFVILERLNTHLALPYFLLKRTDWDKFPGAYYTVGVDCPLLEGRSLQLGSIHHYRQNFSKPFEIKFEDVDGELKYVHQTTYGMSERLVGSIVAFHGDDKGLVLPPDVAPFQIVIVPILAKGKVEEVLAEARKLRDELLAAGLRVTLDERDDRPGSKFYHWEIKGVPLRLELGGRDIAEGKVSYAVRLDGAKGTFLRGNAIEDSQAMLDKISIDMMSNAAKRLASSVEMIKTLDDLPKKILRFGWCGSEDCGHKIEEKTELKLLGTPYISENFQGECIMCGTPTSIVAYAARSM
jgi:prolyl-tRNA synthetase